MVAFATSYEPGTAAVTSENRVGNFFVDVPDRDGWTGSATRTVAGENDRFSYDACRVASLAQEGDPRVPKAGEIFQEYKNRLASMRSDTWEGEIEYNLAVAGPAGIGEYSGTLVNTGSGESIPVAGSVHPLALPLGTVSGRANISVTGYTNPEQLRGVSFGVIHFASVGVAAGPLDLGSLVMALHTNPGSGRTRAVIFLSRGDWDFSNWKFRPGATGGLAGLKNNYAATGTTTPYPYRLLIIKKQRRYSCSECAG